MKTPSRKLRNRRVRLTRRKNLKVGGLLLWMCSPEVVNISQDGFSTVCDIVDSTPHIICRRLLYESIPFKLPSKLRILECYRNNIKTLPPLPVSLTVLDCNYNKIESFPSLPEGLRRLECSHNMIRSFPFLPQSLVYLDCSYNSELRIVPALPLTLKYLFCSGSNISVLPRLPQTLIQLKCSDNKIINLPMLPQSLTLLDFKNNESLQSIPIDLPHSLREMFCNRQTPYNINILNTLCEFAMDTVNNEVNRVMSIDLPNEQLMHDILRARMRARQNNAEIQQNIQDRAVAFTIHNMFKNINMSEYKQLIRVLATQKVKINSLKKLSVWTDSSEMKTENENITTKKSFFIHFKSLFIDYIEQNMEEGEKTVMLSKLDKVINKVIDKQISEDMFPIFMDTVCYVFTQPEKFSQAYVASFIVSNFHAYENANTRNLDANSTDESNVSCAKGIMERIVLCVVDAIEAVYSVKPVTLSDSKKAEYTKLARIFGVTPGEDPISIKDSFQSWFHEFCESAEGVEAPDRTVRDMETPALRKAHALEYIKNRYVSRGISVLPSDISEYLDTNNYIFVDLVLGGRRAARRKRRGGRAGPRKKSRSAPSR